MSTPTLRHRVLAIYKELIHLSTTYPTGAAGARSRVHAAFKANSHLRETEEIERGVRRAEFVRDEIEALYYLKKYRTLRGRYEPFK